MPPFEQQLRIVETVEALLSICAKLDFNLGKRDELGLAFRNSALDALAVAQTPDEFQRAWIRIQDNWEVIAGNSQSIGDLRGLILTFAASGLLVKQDLSEEPPRFESVASTKEIPKNWIWCELDALANYGGNGSVIPKSIPKDGWILDLEDIEKSTSRLLRRSFGADRKTTSNKSSFNSGDVLYGKLRPYLDKVLVADMPGFCTTEIVPIRPKDGLDPNWLRICLKRPEFIKKVTELSYGTKMPRLGTKDAKTSVHPIPPLEEQRRIVERVDQLFQICDQLEQDIILAKNIGDKFARSVVSA
jgi:restriction endonuclease S subunit